ncbi:MAG: BlaI/MecI/CopY family transcriptional regulator [Pygmaiobacter sp.]
MENFKLFDAEYRLMELVWQTAPIGSTQLAALAAERLNWKKSTTYTVLRKLAERKILQNEAARVTPLVTKAQVLHAEGEQLVRKSGSLPLFITAFLDGRPLTKEEAATLQQLITESREGK